MTGAGTLHPERWKRIDDVFAEALEVDAAERAAFVARICAGDEELHAEVLSLLASADGASESLQGVVAHAARDLSAERTTSEIGRKLGPYRLVELIGEGGMGAVYLAERDDDEYKRHVAIKILRHGLGSAQAIARFRDERQILAALDHPGIVRLLDGGRTDGGLPYLVMEHVDGAPITVHATTRSSSVRERLELVLHVCAALQYAHGNLVVHRDIKPSNILVDRTGVPKLLDFGIAKLLSPAAPITREAHTQTGMALLTPEYASPEQARGEPIAVATDVYSLGAVLYELLVGKPPQQPEGGPLEMLRAICEVDPPRPSTVAPAARAAEVAGDLDNIVMKALHKEPARRYASVEQLADDLRRHLDGLPVAARTATFGYRAGKFARRNRGKLALAGIVAIALSSATVVSVREARRADAAAHRAKQRFDEVRRLANSLLFEIDEAIRDVAGATRAREIVVTRALTYLDKLAREAQDDPDLARELAIAYMKIGDIQGSPYDPNIGKTADGLRSYERANALLAPLDASDPVVAAAHLQAAFGTAFMHHTNKDTARARTSLTAALDLARAADIAIDPITIARAHLALAFLEKEHNNVVESERHIDRGLALVATWDRHGDDARYWRAIFLQHRADAAMRAGDPERAAASLSEIAELQASLAADHPNTSKYPRERAYALLLLTLATTGVGDSRLWVANTGDLVRGEAAIREAIATLERQEAEDGENADLKLLLASFRTTLGLVIAKRSTVAALPIYLEALASYERIPAPMRASAYGRENEFIAHCAASHALALVGRRAEAVARARHGLGLARGNAFNVAMCQSLVAMGRRALGDATGAANELEEVLVALRPMVDKADTSALIGVVETLERLASLRPEQRCSLQGEALQRFRARPATTAYLQARLAELEQAVVKCPPASPVVDSD